MNDLKITAGSWRVERSEDFYLKRSRYYNIFADSTADTVVGNLPTIKGVASHIRNKQDAKLIAAAPELLEALRSCQSYLKYNADIREHAHLIEQVNDALNKVTK